MCLSRLSFSPVAVIGFMPTTYTVSEVQDMDSEIDVCVHLLTGTIAPGVSVDYSLEYSNEDADQGMCYSLVLRLQWPECEARYVEM